MLFLTSGFVLLLLRNMFFAFLGIRILVITAGVALPVALVNIAGFGLNPLTLVG